MSRIRDLFTKTNIESGRPQSSGVWPLYDPHAPKMKGPPVRIPAWGMLLFGSVILAACAAFALVLLLLS